MRRKPAIQMTKRIQLQFLTACWGGDNIAFKADALGRQYKTNLLTGKRVGQFGKRAAKGLGSRVPRPSCMDVWAWKQSKRRWGELDDEGKRKFEEEILALACVQVDLALTGDAAKHMRDAVHSSMDLRLAIDDVQSRSHGRTGRQILRMLRSTPQIPKGYRHAPASVPIEPAQRREQIDQKISDFNISTRAFAKESDLTLEARARIIKEAKAAGVKSDFEREPGLVAKFLHDRFEDPLDEGIVPAMPRVSIPKRKRRHRIKATRIHAKIRVPRSTNDNHSSCVANGTTTVDTSTKSPLLFEQVKPIWDQVADNHFMHACVARPVRKAEIARESKAQEAQRKEWYNLRAKDVWCPDVVREFSEVARTARENNAKAHLGRIFGLMVEKGSELPIGDPRWKYKYRVVFQGNNVVDQHWETAIFQGLGSSPASTEAGKMADAYGSFPGHGQQHADAEQAYIQAKLEGEEAWVELPEAAWRGTEHEDKFLLPNGRLRFKRPSVRLQKALYGHPDGGTCWDRHCDVCIKSQGLVPIDDWPSCYFHEKYKLFLMVYVDDFKMAGPEDRLEKGWELVRESGLKIEDPTPPGLFPGCVHERFESIVNGTKVRRVFVQHGVLLARHRGQIHRDGECAVG